MNKILRLVAAFILAAVLAACASMEYQSGGGGTGEPHPGHVGHERH